jgi:hypothetical protein
MYQALKYIFIRIGASLFLLLTFGFLTLYFIHEVALPSASFDDSFIQWAIVFICLFIGFFAYGLVGEQKFHNAMYKLKNISGSMEPDEIIDGFQSLIDFTFSSYFLPGKGKYLRGNVVLKFANYLLFIGRQDSRAQKIFLKAFLLKPEDSTYRSPLLSAFKEDEDLTGEEIELLLVILKAGNYCDDIIVDNLASLFLRKGLFSRQTEPIYLSSLRNKNKNSKKIINLVLPILLKTNRSDFFAINFYLEVYSFESSKASQAFEIIARAYCEGAWKEIDKTLHLRCEAVFESFDHKFRDDMLKNAAEASFSEKIHKLKILNKNDLRLLHKLKTQMGLSLSLLDLSRETALRFLGLTRFFASKLLIIRTWFFTIILVLFLSLIYRGWLAKQEIFLGVEDQSIIVKEKQISGLKKIEIHTFQVAAFSSLKQARVFIDMLKKKGVRDVYQVKTKRKSGESWYKIRVGRFDSKENAQRFARRLIEQKAIKTYFLISLPIS